MNLSDLLERLKKAKGPDRSLDWNVHVDTLGLEGAGSYGAHPAYTASLDQALALCERVLPDLEGWKLEPTWARIYWPDRATTGTGPTPALALLSALLQSLIAQQQETEAR